MGARLKQLGHQVISANGDDMGGFQAISFLPYAPSAVSDAGADSPIDGVYRGASDHRKDGEAVGW
jgi:gamma-glutamyltranspeptidase/glutathione hydrolase